MTSKQAEAVRTPPPLRHSDEWPGSIEPTSAVQAMMATGVPACPEIESGDFLCDRPAAYVVEGTGNCHVHARRRMEEKRRKESLS